MTGAGEATPPRDDACELAPRAAIGATIARLCTKPNVRLSDALIEVAAEADGGQALAAAADRAMVAGLLWSALTTQQRDMLAGEACEALRNRHLGNALRWGATRKLLVDAATTLARAGIPSMPLKGTALQLTVYRDPGQRALTDLDLLVREQDLATAQELLSRGAADVHPPRASHHHLGGIVMPGAGVMIELHGTDTHATLWPQTGEPFAVGSPRTLEGASFVMPDEVDLWLHVACHGLNHAPHYWPRTAADLAHLQGQQGWSAEHWERVWRAAVGHGSPRAVLAAAAIANMGRIPAGLRALAAGATDLDATESRSLEIWSLTTAPGGARFGPWATDWVTGGEKRRSRFREHLFPPPARLSERLPAVRPGLARVLYPFSVGFRCFELAKTGLAWRLALRGRFGLPETVLGS